MDSLLDYQELEPTAMDTSEDSMPSRLTEGFDNSASSELLPLATLF